MSMVEAMRQKSRPQGQREPKERTRGEAPSPPRGGEAATPRQEQTDAGQGLLEQAVETQNMQLAWKRVKANKGAAGVDGLDIAQTEEHLKRTWKGIKARLLNGTYTPEPVRRVHIPKAEGGQRELGIPTVVDRVIQQALLQVLQPLVDPNFSEHSHGFRPGRCAHDAVRQAQRYVQAGHRVVVDIDLEKFFDRVNHDILMQRVKKHVADPAILRLIRAYLNAGIMDGTERLQRQEGTPQGGPLSPLLANILLDEVDKELERRGHHFVRYADDCNVYVDSHKAGQRVMRGMRRLYERLHLRVNEDKSAVASALGRKYLGYELWATREGEVRLAVADKAVRRFKDQVRQRTRRNAGRSLEQVVESLRKYLPGWKAYYALSQTPRVWRELDEWLRRRLRALLLKQWRRGPTIGRHLKALGASDDVAAMVAACNQGWWRKSKGCIHAVLTNAYFDALGVPRLC